MSTNFKSPDRSLLRSLRIAPILCVLLSLAALAATARAQVISVSTNQLTGFTALTGSPSSSQSFNAGGTGLTANITITASAGCQVSLNPNSDYATSVVLTRVGGVVALTPIYVRLSNSAPVGAFSGSVTIQSAGASTQTVLVQGEVKAASAVTITSGNYDAVRNFQMFPYQITTDPSPAPGTFRYSATGLPTQLSVNSDTGVISGVPQVVGSFPVVLGIFFPGNTTPTPDVTKTVTFRILEIGVPNVTSGDGRGEIRVPFNYQIAADNSPTSFGASGLPAGLTINTATGQITGTPTVAGVFDVNISATNASGTGNKTVKFNIFPLRDPVIVSGDTTGIQGQSFFYAITVTDESKPIIQYRAIGLELIGGLTLNAVTGGITGTPLNAGTFSVVVTAVNALGITSKQITITITGASVTLTGNVPQGDTYKLLDRVPWSATVQATGGTTVQPYTWIAYITGRDVYNNLVNIQVGTGTVPILATDRTFDISPGDWTVPNDGTLFNTEAGYAFVVALFKSPPTTPAQLANPFLSLTGRLKIDVIPNLAVPSPAVLYPGPNQKQFFRGGDIVQFQSYWLNNARGERTANGRVQSRPLRSRDRYSVSLRLSSNPAFNIAALPAGETTSTNTPTIPEEDDELPEVTDDVPDDFKLMSIFLAGDLGPGTTPNGFTQIRRAEVTGTPGPLLPYGITGITASQRTYTPQPYDGFLDIGEQVAMVTEQLIPENYVGRFFVAARVAMTNPDLDSAKGNNVFVSNPSPKLEIVDRDGPTLQPASAISDDNGGFVDSGFGASDYSSVSEFGDLIAFESAANNLLVPAPFAAVFAEVNGGGANFANSALYPAISGGATVTFADVQPYLTVGRQVFLRYRDTGEIVLASREVSGVQANAPAINPFISANGKHVAYQSRASNLSTKNTGGRSSIFVFNTETLETALVSVRSNGVPANGDCFRPRLSASGRFVVFESKATNLDPARVVAANAPQQVYLHDRDTDANGIFDEAGKIATYLVSLNRSSVPFNGLSARPAINLNDSSVDLVRSGGKMYVAFTSYAGNAPNSNGGYAMIYRAAVDVTNRNLALRGAIPSQLIAVSLNPAGGVPQAVGYDPMGAFIRPDCDEAAINGDGSVIAFTSAATNFVPNERTGGYTPTYPNGSPLNPSLPPAPGIVPAGDYNRVPDVFVRDLSRPFPGPLSVVRVSVSDERVATGWISFISTVRGRLGPAPGNVPNSQPLPGDSITISDGRTPRTFVFRAAAVAPTDVAIGANVQITRDNLVRAINVAFGGRILAEPTTPPNTFNPLGVPSPGLGYNASIYLKNTFPGAFGNVPVRIVLAARPASPGAVSSIVASGMRGGGRQAEDDALAPGQPLLPPTLGVPFGSGQPSIDRSGKSIAFRTIATNMDVYAATDQNTVPALPPFPGYPPGAPFYPAQQRTLITGELIRPLIFPTANVYLHERQTDPKADVDAPFNTRTTRVSVNNFGYPTQIFGTQPGGVNANTSAANHSPAISANGRFVAFSSDSTGEGGLIFRQNNLSWPAAQRNVRNVFVQDRQSVGPNPPDSATRPSITLTAPRDGLRVPPGSIIPISAVASATNGKTVSSVRLFINGVEIGAPLTSAPYGWSFRLPNQGTYYVRAVVTDSKGITRSASVTVVAALPTGDAPSVALTQPVGQPSNFVLGSSFVFNQIPTDSGGIDPASVSFFVNGAPLPGKFAFDNTYVASYRPSTFGTYSISASASDNSKNTAISSPVDLTIGQQGRQMPAVTILPLTPSSPIVADANVLLQAEVQLFGADAGQSVVQFYADGVYLGDGVAAPPQPGQQLTTYSFNWRTPKTPRAFSQVRARVIAPNNVVTTPGTNGGQGTTTTFFASVFSANFLAFDTLPGAAPSISIVSPPGGSNLSVNQPVTLTADAFDSDGNVESVTFYINGRSFAGVLAPSGAWTGTFTPTSGGLYTAVAVAGDNSGKQRSSSAKTYRVGLPTVSNLQVSLQSPTAASSYVIGSQVLLSANATTSPGVVTGVQFYVNNQPVGPVLTSAPYTFAYLPPALGAYTVYALATDSNGRSLPTSPVSNFRVISEPASGTPTVLLSAPTQFEPPEIARPGDTRLVLVQGADVFVNFTVVTPQPQSIPVNNVKIYINGVAQPGVTKIGPKGDTFAVRWKVGVRTSYSIYATATDAAGTTAVSQVTIAEVVGPSKPQPIVQMLPFESSYPQLAVGSPVKLRARADFRGNEAPTSLEFYANGVFVGLGTPGTPAGGYTPFSLDWIPDVASPSATITARAVGTSASFAVTPRPEPGVIIIGQPEKITVNYFGSAISANVVSPSVVNRPILGVPDLTNSKQRNDQFILWMFNQLLYRNPTVPEYQQYLGLLGGNPGGNASANVKADMVMNLMGYNPATTLFNPAAEYAQTSAIAFAPYGRLGLTPSSASILNFITLAQADESVLPLAGAYGGLAGAPWRATYGMARAMQRTIFDTPAFAQRYPGVNGLIGNAFVLWMTGSGTTPAVMFPGRLSGANSRVDLADMIDNTPTLVSLDAATIRQGAGAAFQSEYVAAALHSGLPGNDPNHTEKVFQRRLQSASLSFQLGRNLQPNGTWTRDGIWNFNAAPLYDKATVAGILIRNGYATAP